MEEKCGICLRKGVQLARHHLIPALEWKRFKRRGRVKGESPAILVCLPCSRHIHAVLTTKELAVEYNTAEKIRAHPEIVKFVGWLKGKNKVSPSKLAKRDVR